MKKDKTYSYSAPNILAISRSIIQINLSQLSPGVSPSLYKIENFPLDSPLNEIEDLFFSSSTCLSNCQNEEGINPIDEKDIVRLIDCQRKSKSASNRLKSYCLAIHEPIIEEDHKEVKEKIKSNILKNEVSSVFNKMLQNVSIKNIILQNPPKMNDKRKQRSFVEGEKVTVKKFTGKLKNFNLRKRFGFIKIEEKGVTSEVFVCEDDLILSGINYKQFKENVYKKKPIYMRFNIQKHFSDSKEVQKAVEIEIV